MTGILHTYHTHNDGCCCVMQVMLVSHASTIVPHLVNAHLRSFAAVDATDNTMSCHTTLLEEECTKYWTPLK